MPTDQFLPQGNAVLDAISRWQKPFEPPAGYKQPSPFSLFNVLPLAFPEKGGVELDLPPALRDTIHGGLEMLKGTQTGELSPEGTLSLFGLLGGPGTMAPKNSMGVFGGRRAATAPLDAMLKADTMRRDLIDDPYSPSFMGNRPEYQNLPYGSQERTGLENVYEQTGIHFGPDEFGRVNVPRFEIKSNPGWDLGKFEARQNNYDPNETIYSLGLGNNFKLPDVYYDPQIFTAYPELMDFNIRRTSPMDWLTQGGLDYKNKQLYLAPSSSLDQMSSIMEHELQHGVQYLEDWPVGANPQEFQDASLRTNFELLKPKFDFANEEAKNFLQGRFGREARPSDFHVEHLFKDAADDPTKYSSPFNLERIQKAKDNLEYLKGSLGPNLWRDLAEGMAAKLAVKKDQEKAYDTYKTTYGEAEARNAQHRFLTRAIQDAGFPGGTNRMLPKEAYSQYGGNVTSPYSGAFWENMIDWGLGGRMKSPYSTLDVPMEELWTRFFYPLEGEKR